MSAPCTVPTCHPLHRITMTTVPQLEPHTGIAHHWQLPFPIPPSPSTLALLLKRLRKVLSNNHAKTCPIAVAINKDIRNIIFHLMT